MNAFADACRVEDQSWAVLKHFVASAALEGRYVTTNKGRLARELQKSVGDVLMNRHNGDVVAIEIKAEESNQHGNLFIETWSNKSRFTLGWVYTLNADILLYHFIAQDELYVIDFQKLRTWLFADRDGKPNIDRYREAAQAKRDQLNDTWGRCVRIADIKQHVGFRLERPAQLWRGVESLEGD